MRATVHRTAWAVVKRWDSKDWSDHRHTAEFIYELRDALEEDQRQHQGLDALMRAFDVREAVLEELERVVRRATDALDAGSGATKGTTSSTKA